MEVIGRVESGTETESRVWNNGRGRATQDAKAENRSVYAIHEDSVPSGYSSTALTQLSRKKAFSEAPFIQIL